MTRPKLYIEPPGQRSSSDWYDDESAGRMGAGDSPQRSGVNVFEKWNSTGPTRDSGSQPDPLTPVTSKVFEKWNSMSRSTNNSQPETPHTDTLRVFEHWYSMGRSANGGRQLNPPQPDTSRAFNTWDSMSLHGKSMPEPDALAQQTEYPSTGPLRLAQQTRDEHKLSNSNMLGSRFGYKVGTGPPTNLQRAPHHPQDENATKDDKTVWKVWNAGAIANAARWPHAALHMIWYLNRWVGEWALIDFPELIADNPPMQEMYDQWKIDAVLYARKLSPGQHHIVTPYQRVTVPLNPDWHHATGDPFGLWAEADVYVGETDVEIEFTLHFYDWYDWDEQGDYPGLFHKRRIAREYIMKGSKTENIVVPRYKH